MSWANPNRGKGFDISETTDPKIAKVDVGELPDFAELCVRQFGIPLLRRLNCSEP